MNNNLQHSLLKIADSFTAPQNETVLVQWWGDTADQALLDQFASALSCKNLKVTTILYDAQTVTESFNQTVGIEGETLSSEHLRNIDFARHRESDSIIDICRFSPPSLIGAITAEAKPAFIKFMQTLFGAISSPRNQFIQLRLPSEEAAIESGLGLETYEALWHQLVAIDYEALKAHCHATINQYANAKQFQIKTGENCILTFSTEGRSWYADHGNGDFPAGEVYIAPVEDSANGDFFTPVIHFDGKHLKNVTLTFRNGLLTACSHPEIIDGLEGAPGDALKFAEFGLGLNPNHSSLCGYNLFDEKALGSCHIAIGMNHLFGGQNDSPLHIDFVAPNPFIQGE